MKIVVDNGDILLITQIKTLRHELFFLKKNDKAEHEQLPISKKKKNTIMWCGLLHTQSVRT